MFVCEDCLKKHESGSLSGQSYGRCERCKVSKPCVDLRRYSERTDYNGSYAGYDTAKGES